MSYIAPVKDMLFNIEHLARIDQIAQIPGFEDAGLETAQAVLEECAKLNESVIAPLNWEGDKYPSSFHDGKVTTTPGFKEAYRQYAEGGWQGLQHPAEFGGQGLPKIIGAACGEILQAANMSFALCPLLTDGAIEALLTAGSDDLKAIYLEKLMSGHWTGTMNLTEPQAGSDLAPVRTRAEPQPDGTYKVFGTKIFITYGEHDMADNIVHLVLARVAGRARRREGHQPVRGAEVHGERRRQRGRSQRRVLRQHRAQDGHQGQPHRRAAVWRPRRRHRLPGGRGKPWPGIHVHHDERRALRRGRAGHRGCRTRLPEGRAATRKDRVQSRPVDGSVKGPATIIHHPDVRRMLMTMRA
jgi:alkylation response protein AidB-like acyl-CoA dehydrogenase